MSVVTLHTAEYTEIVRRLDKIAELQKQILLAAQARDPKPKRSLPPRNGQPWTEEEKRGRGLPAGPGVAAGTVVPLKRICLDHSLYRKPRTVTPIPGLKVPLRAGGGVWTGAKGK